MSWEYRKTFWQSKCLYIYTFNIIIQKTKHRPLYPPLHKTSIDYLMNANSRRQLEWLGCEAQGS